MDDGNKVNYHKTQIDLISFEIDLLDDLSKIEVIKHLEETLSLLKIGSRNLLFPKKIKLEKKATSTDRVIETEDNIQTEEDSVKTEDLGQYSVPPIVDEDAIRAMYEGLIPTCTECSAKFPSLGALDNHSKMHEEQMNVKFNAENKPNKNDSNSNDFNCPECGKYCFSKKNLLRHRVIHSNRYQCNTCGKSFYDSTSLVAHNRSEANCLRYMNTLMNQTVNKEAGKNIAEVYNRIETERTDNNRFISSLSVETESSDDVDSFGNSFTDVEDVTMEETISDAGNLEESVVESSEPVGREGVGEYPQTETPKDKRQCPTCLHKFSSMSRFRYHKQNPENCKKFLTKDSSPKSFFSVDIIEVDSVAKETETKEYIFETPSCENIGEDKVISDERSSYDDVQKLYNDTQEENVDVLQLEDESKEETGLKTESSTALKKYVCEVCHKSFSLNNTLSTHMNVHSDKFMCTSCHHRFSTQRQLAKHNEDLLNCQKYLKKSETTKVEDIEVEKNDEEKETDSSHESFDDQSFVEDDMKNEDYADLFDNNSSAVDEDDCSDQRSEQLVETLKSNTVHKKASDITREESDTSILRLNNKVKLQCPVCLHNFSSQARLRGHRKNPEKCKKFLKSLQAKEGKNLQTQNQTIEELSAPTNLEDKSINIEEEDASLEYSDNSYLSTKDDPQIFNRSEREEESAPIKKERKKYMVNFCEICSIEIKMSSKKSHEKGVVHQEMLIQKCLGISKGPEDPFSCRWCKKFYTNAKVFHNHLSRVCTRQELEKEVQQEQENFVNGTENGTKFNCRECDAILTSNEAFAAHMSHHEDDMETSDYNISTVKPVES